MYTGESSDGSMTKWCLYTIVGLILATNALLAAETQSTLTSRR